MLKESIKIGKTDLFLYITIVDELWVICYSEVDNTGENEMQIKMPPFIMVRDSDFERAQKSINTIIQNLTKTDEPRQARKTNSL